MERRHRKPGEMALIYILVFISVFSLFAAYKISGFSSLSSPGAFPMFTTIVLVVMALGVWREAKNLSPGPVSGMGEKFREVVNLLFTREVAGIILALVIYSLALEILTFIPATLLFLWGSMLFLKAGKWHKALFYSILNMVIIIVIFNFIFKVVLP